MLSDNLAGLRVLLVEDDVLLAMEMEDLLADLGCSVVGPFGRLEAAVDAARKERLDGAIMDLNLRGELSFPAIEVLREREIPLIVCSGYADLPDMRERLAGLPLLSKPFDPARVVTEIRANFCRAGQPHHSAA